jgi:tRNA pseudouridine38-40 synthase
MNYRASVAYDGTDFHGWQLQKGHRTIQGELQEALTRLDGGPVIVHGAGRTDAGVHAEGQVVSFRLARDRKEDQIRRAVNGNLPEAIRLFEVRVADDNFHARFDARSKMYQYQIDLSEVANPLLARFVWHYPFDIDLERLRTDANLLTGTHDFTAFTVSDCEAVSRVRTLTSIGADASGSLLTMWFIGDGFLRGMVRTMVTALLDANRGRLAAGSITALLESCDRGLCGAAAPAKGLTLMKVEY